MSRASEQYLDSRRRAIKSLKDAAAKAVADGDPWAKHNIPAIPAERIIRHLYHPDRKEWSSDESIVKIEKEPFTHGAMRYCYRMKKRSPPPLSSNNHRFHAYGWARASNFVAKAYHNKETGLIDTSEESKKAIRNDIMLQYEAMYWAEKFNETDPTTKISFIRAYAIEFPNRPGKPWFAVERFISGTDSYGVGFVKHNTNAGFVDLELHRVTPQVFSAHSFYASKGTRLVADIQGVGDLYTDPQVLSSDYRFGDGDLGPRGMALFFKSFRHNALSDACGIPIFKLSRNELKAQVKYVDEENSDTSSVASSDKFDLDGAGGGHKALDKFAKLDENRQRRASLFKVPSIIQDAADVPEEEQLTERRSNMVIRDAVRKSLRKSFKVSVVKKSTVPKLERSKSDIDEIKTCLAIAKSDPEFDHTMYNRTATGQIKDRYGKSNSNRIEDESSSSDDDDVKEISEELKRLTASSDRRSLIVRRVSAPIPVGEETKINLGKVHFQLAVLHGMGRFPDVVPNTADRKDKNYYNDDNAPDHDVFSVFFHLCHAASFRNVSACIAIARVQAGLDSVVSDLLRVIVPIDFDSAKSLLQRAMEYHTTNNASESSLYIPAAPKAAAGCLLYQILQDERESITFEASGDEDEAKDDTTDKPTASHNTGPTDHEIMKVLEDTLKLITLAETEEKDIKNHKERLKRSCGGVSFHKGDKILGNFAMEGTYYPGVVDDVSDDGNHITVMWEDDGSTEILTKENVKHLVPPTMTMTNDNDDGEPLSDEQALGFENTDEKFSIPKYELQADLAELKARNGDKTTAAELYEEAAEGAMNDNKMKTATEWSMKAAELLV